MAAAAALLTGKSVAAVSGLCCNKRPNAYLISLATDHVLCHLGLGQGFLVARVVDELTDSLLPRLRHALLHRLLTRRGQHHVATGDAS